MMRSMNPRGPVRAGWMRCWWGGASWGVLLLPLQGCTPEGGGSNPHPDPNDRSYKFVDAGAGDSNQDPPRLDGLELCSEEYDEELEKRVCIYKTDCDDPAASAWVDYECDGLKLRNKEDPRSMRPDFTFCREISMDGRRACIYQRNCDEQRPSEYQIDLDCDGIDFIYASVKVVKRSRPPIDLSGKVECQIDQLSGTMVFEFEPRFSSPVVLPRRGNLEIWQIRSPDGNHEEIRLTSGEIRVGARIRLRGTMSDFVHWIYAMGIPGFSARTRGVHFEVDMPTSLPLYEIRMDGLVIEKVWVDGPKAETADATEDDGI